MIKVIYTKIGEHRGDACKKTYLEYLPCKGASYEQESLDKSMRFLVLLKHIGGKATRKITMVCAGEEY